MLIYSPSQSQSLHKSSQQTMARRIKFVDRTSAADFFDCR
jgi:hypothetical protein